MPTKRSEPVEVINLTRGLITEASPLQFPPDATRDERNYEIKTDGTRRRRFGVGYEVNYTLTETGLLTDELDSVSVGTYTWSTVGNDTELTIIVVAVGNTLYFHQQVEGQAISQSALGSITVGVTPNTPLSFASVDGFLVVVNGDGLIYTISYDGSSFTTKESRIKVRDTFGVDDIVDGVDLTEDNNISLRPSLLTDNHLYNVRNQSWGVPRAVKGLAGAIRDPLDEGHTTNDYLKYASNADIQHAWVRPDPQDDVQESRFFPDDFQKNPPYNLKAPQGYFIIDLLQRGISRNTEYAANQDKHPELVLDLGGSLPSDTTEGGATQVEEFAGRVFYGGFSGDVIDGDNNSPRLSGYIAYSKLVEKPSDVTKCYQEGDPTAPETSDVVATDGGILRISGMERLISLKAVGDSLFVVATNGVWRVRGGNDQGFDSTNILSSKVAKHGPTQERSVLEVEDTLFYWAQDGIYQLAPDQFGNWGATNLTFNTIQTFYDAIEDKNQVESFFDTLAREAHFIYGTELGSQELIFNLNFGAFTINEFLNTNIANNPQIRGYVEASPFDFVGGNEFVTADGDLVLSDGIEVVFGGKTATLATPKELNYLILCTTGTNEKICYTFGLLNNLNFVDWVEADGVGVDAKAYMLGGEFTAEDVSRHKQATYLTFVMEQTESGFDSDYVPLDPSSCMLRSQWDFTDSITAGKWSNPRQMYRHRRHFTVDSSDDAFESGYYLVVTKNKLPGRGKSLSLYMETEPTKDCRIVGWSTAITGNAVV
jgi:hypothetical protein